ncbi:hypothetical protein [Mycoplasma sp. CSL7503-lung]|uniref:hypothetical protein n=1 Tax=Mycoplasma sp. CSL7503-lung TaxID=536372 RepID=UPI0021D0D18A|nr:hypothetical protein [Mycoplasma sp. CSL7503-lung]MCU4706583.1 hypothetical protein [Mycoplasma sp. CSL7503-lung]
MKFKKIKFLMGGIVLSTLAPLSAVSCFYDSDNSVKFSDKFVKNNLFNNVTFNPKDGYFKKDEAYKQKEFVKDIIETKKLIYTFSNVDVALPNIVSVDNQHLNKLFNDFYELDYSSIKINTNKINDYKNQFDAVKEKIKKEKDAYPNTDSDGQYVWDRLKYVEELLGTNFNNLEALKTTISELTNEIQEYKELEPNQTHKDLFRIKRYIFNDKRDTGILVDKEKEIQKRLIALDNFFYFDLTNIKNVVTEADVKWIVNAFIKDTPFATYDVLSKESSKNETSAEEYLKIGNPILSHDSSSYKFNVSISPQIVEDAIPRNVFEKITGNNLNLFLNSQNKRGSELLKELFKNFITNYSNFKVDSLDSLSNGISLGFGPTHLLQGIDRINKEKSFEFQIFTFEKDQPDKQIELDAQQNEEFLKNPIEFIESHLYLIIYKYSSDSINELRNRINKYVNLNNTLRAQMSTNPKSSSLNSRLIKENEARIVEAEVKLKKFEEEIEEVERIQTSRAYIDKLNLPEKDEQFLTKFRQDHKEDIDKIINFVREEANIAKSTQFSLNEIFAKILFLLENKTQIILGTKPSKTDSTQREKTYWLEVQESNEEWKAYDIYSLFQDTKTASSLDNVNFNDYEITKEKINQGQFIIDPAFVRIANVK